MQEALIGAGTKYWESFILYFGGEWVVPFNIN